MSVPLSKPQPSIDPAPDHRARKPRVLLTVGHKTPTAPYTHAIAMAGAEVEVMLPGAGIDLPSDIDGVVLAGGASVEPPRYGASIDEGLMPTMDIARDEMEFSVLDQALGKGIPVLGICRGFQVLNVYFGGTLHQALVRTGYDLPHRNDLARDALVHTVTATGGRLLDILGAEPRGVNSIHKQGVRDLAPGVAATGHSEDGLIEAFEALDGQVVAVQWHPEELVDADPAAAGLFTDLIARIRTRQLEAAS